MYKYEKKNLIGIGAEKDKNNNQKTGEPGLGEESNVASLI